MDSSVTNVGTGQKDHPKSEHIHMLQRFAAIDFVTPADTSRQPSMYNVAIWPSLRYLLVELPGEISNLMSFE